MIKFSLLGETILEWNNNPDGSPKYEDTCVYAILEKEWNTIRQW